MTMLLASVLGTVSALAQAGLSEADEALRRGALDQVLAGTAGVAQSWSDINAGRRGQFLVTRDATRGAAGRCRTVAETIWFGPDKAEGQSTLCRTQPGAPWRIMENTMGAAETVPADIAPIAGGAALPPLPIQVWVTPTGEAPAPPR